ncbi:hypothetical protein K438DRAFT_1939772 [Mycena galopus ATCC 62051]|nr:hypothetical protein K438DRAFT_1939772 [Mycena galopus ATCC 62051]
MWTRKPYYTSERGEARAEIASAVTREQQAVERQANKEAKLNLSGERNVIQGSQRYQVGRSLARPREATPKGCPKNWIFEVEIWPFPCPKIGFSRPKFVNPCPKFWVFEASGELFSVKSRSNPTSDHRITVESVGPKETNLKVPEVAALENWVFEAKISEFFGQPLGGASRGLLGRSLKEKNRLASQPGFKEDKHGRRKAGHRQFTAGRSSNDDGRRLGEGQQETRGDAAIHQQTIGARTIIPSLAFPPSPVSERTTFFLLILVLTHSSIKNHP